MKKLYLLNDIVLFDPEERSLVQIDATKARKIILHSPASECLRLLLLHNDQPVSQRYLFGQVWEKNGAYVTVNTLYQNMGSIRKGLKIAGLSDDVIKTLPKIGFKISVNLSEIVSEAEQTATVADLKISGGECEKEATEKKEVSTANVTRVFQRGYYSFERKYRWLCGIAGILVIVFIWGCILKILPVDTSYYSAYRFAGTLNGCDLYSSYPDDEKSLALFSELMKKHPLQCHSKKITYMAINRMYEASSLLLCDQKITGNDARCVSFVFISDKNEN
ncbi:winged helix-turn-helix domain-containing protein [Rahnella bruchi]|uniref:winged helix-turn-helix domain-containing protein n=1 Tax=Rahnella bruchi TaxID=1510573 RepID=UPI000EA3A713|nr:winged helix-turn-helix domain-containing protein [Rahnella bruchi]